MIGSIYFVINKITGKYYIGQTVQKISDRWVAHRRSSLRRHTNHYFSRAIRKYGPRNFEIRTLFTCYDRKTLSDAESYFINLFSSNDKRYGYNCTSGGEKYELTQEHKNKIRSSLVGRKRSKEFCERMKKIASDPSIKEAKSKAWKGKTRGQQSTEHREKNRKGHLGNKHSKEAREKMSKIQYEIWNKRKENNVN